MFFSWPLITLLLYESITHTSKELSSPIFQSLSVSQSVRHLWHNFFIYKGINALYLPKYISSFKNLASSTEQLQQKSLWLNFQLIPSRLFSSRCTGASPIKFINTHTQWNSLTKPDAIVAVCPQPWSWPPQIIHELVFSVWPMVLKIFSWKWIEHRQHVSFEAEIQYIRVYIMYANPSKWFMY